MGSLLWTGDLRCGVATSEWHRALPHCSQREAPIFREGGLYEPIWPQRRGRIGDLYPGSAGVSDIAHVLFAWEQRLDVPARNLSA